VGSLVIPVGEQVAWIAQKRLQVGDEIDVKVVEASAVDPPNGKTPD
jgi:hypothetical protein